MDADIPANLTSGRRAKSPFSPPVKRSVTIAGHQTAISLEPIFWEALQNEAGRLNLPLNALVARIDLDRMSADPAPNLASAIRCWLFAGKEDKNYSQ